MTRITVAMSEHAILPRYHPVVMGIIRNIPGSLGVYALRAFNLYLRRRNTYLVKTKTGFVIVCSPRELIQVCIMQFGHWEPNISAALRSLIRPGSCVVDVGANIGYDTLLMSNAVGPRGSVISFEALTQTFQALQKNLSLNKVENVRAACLAISNKAGTPTIYQGASTNSGNASIVHKEGRVVAGSVSALPLHEALTEIELTQLEFIKIDVEGAELPILSSILHNITLFPALLHILVEVSSAEDEASWNAVWDGMRGNKFVAYAIDNEYSYASYLHWRKPAPPRRIASLPKEQADVLFTRADISHLI